MLSEIFFDVSALRRLRSIRVSFTWQFRPGWWIAYLFVFAFGFYGWVIYKLIAWGSHLAH